MNSRIDGQLNLVAACAQIVLHLRPVGRRIRQAVHLQQNLDAFLHRVFNVMRIGVHPAGSGILFRRQHIGCCRIQRRLIFLPADKLVFVHAPEHIIRPVVGRGGVIPFPVLTGIVIPPGIVIVRIIGHTGQHGAFPKGQFPEFLPEIAFRGHLDAVVVLAQINRVQVALQNLILGIAGFQLHREISFLDFTLVALLR